MVLVTVNARSLKLYKENYYYITKITRN